MATELDFVILQIMLVFSGLSVVAIFPTFLTESLPIVELLQQSFQLVLLSTTLQTHT